MYSVDALDIVCPLADLPQSSVGAPLPYILADEFRVVVAFYVEAPAPGWDGTSIQVVGPNTPGHPVAVIRFHGAYAHLAGPPNDEAFNGHPLASRGLRPYGAFEIRHSSWIRAMAAMNAVHPYHRPELFAPYRHFVLSFHDSTFECVAKKYEVHVTPGPVAAAVPLMARLVSTDAA